MNKIVFTGPVPAACLEPRDDRFELDIPAEKDLSAEELREKIRDAVAVVIVGGFPMTEDLLKEGKNLKVVGTCTVGYDHIDVDYCRRHGILVVNTPQTVIFPAAELTVGLILSAVRSIVKFDRQLHEALGFRLEYFISGTMSLRGKRVGIVGFGRIGKKVAEMLKPFGAELYYSDPFRASPEIEAAYGVQYTSLEELLRESDVVTLHCPYVPENHYLINRQTLSMMKDGAYLINVARGKLVEESALIEALRSGKLAGAALDVFENELALSPELAGFDNVVMTPHVGTGAYNVRIEMCRECISGVYEALNGGQPYQLVKPAH